MKIHIDRIGPEGVDVDEPVTTDWLTDALGAGSEFTPAGDGRLSVHLTRAEDVVHVRGRIWVDLGSDCARCLEPVEIKVASSIDVTVFPRGEEPEASTDGELSEDDMGIATYDNREIDLSSVVHDEVFLELPMRPLCSESCAGLCPTCGQNLNNGPCACEPKTPEHWSALRQIKLS